MEVEAARATADAYLIGVYVIYGAIAVGLTAWLAKTLSSNGAVFLEGVFEDRPGMAPAVNRLLVIGFYMLNLGYAFLILKAQRTTSAIDSVEVLITKLGILLVSLGAIHFVNMAIFWRIQRRHEFTELPPPIRPLTDPMPKTG